MHHDIHHFAMGRWLLLLAYVVSVAGSFTGLACTRRAVAAGDGPHRTRWLLIAAISIGGVGIWLMHFIAMLGFTVPGVALRYDLWWTAGSAALSISAVFIGLLVLGPTVRAGRLLIGGLITGLAVNLMHYTGMRAIRFQGRIHYDTRLVALSVLIAVVAATAALLFTLILESTPLRLIGGAVMGVAVVGMHYTGMAAVRVEVDPALPAPVGMAVFSFLFPVFVLGLLGLAVPITALLTTTPAAPSARPRSTAPSRRTSRARLPKSA
ncbi:MHYT domain-containing protein [Nocardia arthritidis]|uniref:Signal protein n=1 Tax=Nocardia arthritidis TaxID=228602 RepID=A0A6G9YLI0_9NOCA|nr:MHYT domain-containing protein [Nocardia arthritidis]QIS14064.1 signal protein [Nocardia arthritidis]